jgi:hypothetical protein
MSPPVPTKHGANSQFYEELKVLDRGIAERWRARTHDRPEFVLDGPDVEAIVRPLIHKGGMISRAQAAAIMKLLVEVKFTGGGVAVLKVWLEFAQSDGRFNDAADPLTSEGDLAAIFNAIGMGAVSFVNFVSPGTGLAYAPSAYLAIQKLIANGDIVVLEVKIGGLEKKADLPIRAAYRSDLNKLFVYQSLTPAAKTVMLVHECTHAIQDWRDVRAKMKFTEADAFIAGAVAELSLHGGHPLFVGAIVDEAIAAARIVMNGPAVLDNKAWVDAYAAVVTAVENSEAYKGVADVGMLSVQKGESSHEKDLMTVLEMGIEMKQKQDAAVFASWAKSAWNGTFAGLSQRIANALP